MFGITFLYCDQAARNGATSSGYPARVFSKMAEAGVSGFFQKKGA